MSREQAELEVGSPAVSSMYGKQDEYPTAYNLEGAEYSPYERHEQSIKRSYTLPTTILILSMTLLLCCAGAAVASYFAVVFHERAVRCSSGEPQPIAPALNSTLDVSSFVPTSSCSSLNASYTSAVSSAKFIPHCRTWFQGNNLLGVYVYTFEACMDACASFNGYDYMHNSTRCYSVTYDAVKEDTGRGNCWLKARPNIAATARNVTDSAVLE